MSNPHMGGWAGERNPDGSAKTAHDKACELLDTVAALTAERDEAETMHRVCCTELELAQEQRDAALAREAKKDEALVVCMSKCEQYLNEPIAAPEAHAAFSMMLRYIMPALATTPQPPAPDTETEA